MLRLGGGGRGELACRFSGFGEPTFEVVLAMLNVEATQVNKRKIEIEGERIS